VIVAALLCGAAVTVVEAVYFPCPWGYWLCGSSNTKK
jgi:hypothetical protein